MKCTIAFEKLLLLPQLGTIWALLLLLLTIAKGLPELLLLLLLLISGLPELLLLIDKFSIDQLCMYTLYINLYPISYHPHMQMNNATCTT